MKGEKLYESMNHVDDQILERSERRKQSRRRPWWMGAVAAVLVAAVAVGVMLRPEAGITAQAIVTAKYPEMAPYPLEEDYYDEATGEVDYEAYDQAYDAWWESRKALSQEAGYANGLDSFFQKSIPVFLSGKEGENAAYSPVNAYMALAMLGEVTGGSSRQQILDLLGCGSIEQSREQANAVWKGQYQDDQVSATILANSVWLRDGASYNQDTLQILGEDYYASSFQGTMGSEEYSEMLRAWLNEQTRDLLKDQTAGIELTPETVFALASTIYYKAAWGNEFSPQNTAPQTFHSPQGDVEVDFMHEVMENEDYYRGENFGIVRKYLKDGKYMWMILPDEGTAPEELLEQGDAVDVLLSEYNWEEWERCEIHLALPKFDVASDTDLLGGLQSLGVTDVMDSSLSDFTPMTTEASNLYLSMAQHAVRVKVDEEGVEAAAYTVLAAGETSEAPPPRKIDFVLDRPFLFAITSQDGLPLFVGVVNQP